MAKLGKTYVIQTVTPHAQATSTGTADTKTLTAPNSQTAGVIITVETTSARVTWDGTTPSSSNGLVIQAGAAPLFIPLGETIKFNATAAANSIVNVLWLL